MELTIDEIGMSQTSGNRDFHIKFIIIQNHLENKKKHAKVDDLKQSSDKELELSQGWELISKSGHPIKRLVKRFSREINTILHSKMARETQIIKQENMDVSLNDALKKIITNGQHNSNQQMKMFQWLYDRAVLQIIKFSEILN